VLSEKRANDGVHIAHIAEYYSTDIWSIDYLKELGYTQLPDEAIAFRNDIHTDLHYESIMAVVDPSSVRADSRFAKGKYVVHGIEIDSKAELIALGKNLISCRVDITIEAIKARLANP
jgi:hypothetical protein